MKESDKKFTVNFLTVIGFLLIGAFTIAMIEILVSKTITIPQAINGIAFGSLMAVTGILMFVRVSFLKSKG